MLICRYLPWRNVFASLSSLAPTSHIPSSGCATHTTLYRTLTESINSMSIRYLYVTVQDPWQISSSFQAQTQDTARSVTFRERPKFGFGCGFGAETDLKCSFCSVSVTVPTRHFTFGFGRNYTAADRNWPKLWSEWASGRPTTLNVITYIA